MTPHLPLLVVYSTALVAGGLWIGRRVRDSGAFFVAGRRLGPLLLFATVLAANIGAGSTVGAGGLGYREGLGAWWWVGSAAVGTLLLAVWIGPRMWRLAAEHDLKTVGDYLELRYGPSVRGVVAALLWVGTLAILAGQLIAMAWVLDAVAGIPKPMGCLLGGVAMTLYFTAGGLLTSAWVNLAELAVLLAGFGVALPLALAAAGGWGGLAAHHPTADYWGFAQGGGSGWRLLFLLVPAFMVSPGLVQKVYGARDVATVRRGVGWSAAALCAFAAIPPLLGMVARQLHPGLPTREMALPTLLTADLPPALGVLALAAVFSAEISSADAILFMLATSLSQDLYRRFLNPAASDRQLLGVARLAALTGGALGILLALALPTVIESLTVFYSLLGVSLFVPLVAGLHCRRPGVPEALAGVAGGVAGWAAVRLAAPGWNPVVSGLAVSAAGYFGVALLRRGPRRGV